MPERAAAIVAWTVTARGAPAARIAVHSGWKGRAGVRRDDDAFHDIAPPAHPARTPPPPRPPPPPPRRPPRPDDTTKTSRVAHGTPARRPGQKLDDATK